MIMSCISRYCNGWELISRKEMSLYDDLATVERIRCSLHKALQVSSSHLTILLQDTARLINNRLYIIILQLLLVKIRRKSYILINNLQLNCNSTYCKKLSVTFFITIITLNAVAGDGVRSAETSEKRDDHLSLIIKLKRFLST